MPRHSIVRHGRSSLTATIAPAFLVISVRTSTQHQVLVTSTSLLRGSSSSPNQAEHLGRLSTILATGGMLSVGARQLLAMSHGALVPGTAEGLLRTSPEQLEKRRF